MLRLYHFIYTVLGLCAVRVAERERESLSFVVTEANSYYLRATTTSIPSSPSIEDANEDVKNESNNNNNNIEDISNDENNINDENDTHLRFARENLLDGINHRCGTFKCYYPLLAPVAVNDDKKSAGYVAGTDFTLEQSLWAAYNFSTSVIEQEFAMTHTALRPPETVELFHGENNNDLAAWMDQNKTGSNDQPRDDVPRFRGHDRAYVQLVLDVSPASLSSTTNEEEEDDDDDDSALFWGTSDRKNALGMSVLEPWLRSISKKENFANRFHEDAHKLQKLLDAHECLYDDFQMFVLKSGAIVHFDVDRCFWFGDDGAVNEKGIDPETIRYRRGMIDKFVQQVSESLAVSSAQAMTTEANEE